MNQPNSTTQNFVAVGLFTVQGETRQVVLIDKIKVQMFTKMVIEDSEIDTAKLTFLNDKDELITETIK